MSITQRAEDVIFSVIEEYRKINKDISAFKYDSKRLVEYLGDIRITITPSYALKRLICNKFSCRKDSKTGQYILAVTDKSGNGICVDDYENPSSADSGYIEALVALAKRAGVPVTRQNATNWFQKSYTRSSFFKIAFALGLTSDEVQAFLMKELGETGYNFKSCEETVYWFCATYEQYNSYKCSCEIIEAIENAFDKNISPVTVNTQYYKSILEGVETRDELIDRIIKNKEYFFFYPSDSKEDKEKKGSRESQKEVREKRESYLASKKLRRAFCELLDEAKRLYSLATREEYTNEKLAYTIWDGIPREGDDSVVRTRKRDSSTMGEYVSLKNTRLPSHISQNILIRDRMDGLCSGKIAVTRKDILTIFYFVITQKVEMALSKSFGHTEYAEEFEEIAANINEENPYLNMVYFQDEIDLMLDDLGFSPLYAPNRFDNIILLSTISVEPAQFFSDILETVLLYEE